MHSVNSYQDIRTEEDEEYERAHLPDTRQLSQATPACSSA